MNDMFLKNLQVPSCIVDAVLDTDTYNEIDDQFALSYMLASSDRINTRAIYAAPFHNSRSTGPKDGMEKSYDEIITLLEKSGHEELKPVTYKGSEMYLPDEKTFVPSPAAEDLAKRAMNYSPEKPLYVVAIGAITNVASALLINPAIKNNIVIVWLGGHAIEWPDTREFNMYQDVPAARVVFGCGAPVIILPCMGVVDRFTITKPELEYWFKGKSALCDHLADAAIEEADSYAAGKPWSRVIWDVTAVAYLLNDNNRFMSAKMIPAPIPQLDNHYSFDPRRHPVMYVYAIHRDALMTDLVNKLTKA